jgi:hypothetical protein
MRIGTAWRGILAMVLIVAAVVVWVATPSTGVAAALPYLLLLACPLLHLLHHRGHGPKHPRHHGP